MFSLRLHTPLIPPTLLPLLHDCIHCKLHLWFAELEVVYQSCINMDEMIDSTFRLIEPILRLQAQDPAAAAATLLVGRSLVYLHPACRPGDRHIGAHKAYSLRGLHWHLLVIARLLYFHHVLKSDRAINDPAFLAQLTFFSTGYGVHLPPLDPSLPPPYLPSRPPSAAKCALLHWLVWGSRLRGTSDDDAEKLLRSRLGWGEEEEWICGMRQAEGEKGWMRPLVW
ncbi:hypothetical protein JCM6882_001633 [Rhodosporidiobolus microsporus]